MSTCLVLSLSTVCISGGRLHHTTIILISRSTLSIQPERVVVGRYLKRRWAIGAHQVSECFGAILGLAVSPYIFIINVFFDHTALVLFRAIQTAAVHRKFYRFIADRAYPLLILTVHYPANRHLVLHLCCIFLSSFHLIRGSCAKTWKTFAVTRPTVAAHCPSSGVSGAPKLSFTRSSSYFVVALFVMARALQNNLLTLLFLLLLIPIAITGAQTLSG